MFIKIYHKSNEFKQNNFKKYSTKEFSELVSKIAENCGIKELPEVEICEMDSVGQCSIFKFGDSYCIDRLRFNKNILTGNDYSILQIGEIIKHEISHMIATLCHNDDCGHDQRWKNIAKIIGCQPVTTLNIAEYNLPFHVEITKEDKLNQKCYLRCSKCSKIIRKANIFMPIFKFFAFSVSDLPVMMGNLKNKSECCNSIYYLEIDVETAIKELKKEKVLQHMQRFLEDLIEHENKKY